MTRWLFFAAVLWGIWWWISRRSVRRDAPARDPYAVLELTRDASRDEITRAYREQIKLYHPDKVADLGSELQRLAHAKTVEIQRAYEALTKNR